MRLLTLFRLPFAIALLLTAGALVAGVFWLAALGLVAMAAVYVLGRDPVRAVPSQPLGIVSPVDGRVASVGTGQDPFLERDALLVRLRQGPLAPAILCSPAEGRVERMWSGPGLAEHEAGGRLAVHIRTDEDDDVVFVVGRATHGFPGPLRWSVQPGERVGQGQRRGLAAWGRWINIYLPAGSVPAVESGAHVNAGADLVCQLVHAP